MRETAFGNTKDAEQAAAKGLKPAPSDQGTAAEAAIAFAMAGDTERAESMAKELNKRFPLHMQMQSLWLPAIQAQSALDRKNPKLALSTLEPVTPVEFGAIVFTLTECLYPTYIRGQAYLAIRMDRQRLPSFRKFWIITLWKDADRDTPIYKEAKAEYARAQ